MRLIRGKAAALAFENSGSLFISGTRLRWSMGLRSLSELVQVRNFLRRKVDVGIHLAGDLLR
jgi:hypothetical protein